jgi:hypothetical protein
MTTLRTPDRVKGVSLAMLQKLSPAVRRRKMSRTVSASSLRTRQPASSFEYPNGAGAQYTPRAAARSLADIRASRLRYERWRADPDAEAFAGVVSVSLED